ncbi:MAG: hypothetical protein MUE72_05115 [Chitinophagaceae bacterium]|nr:hypothetical protein [Chitinophagaceae bacterium]
MKAKLSILFVLMIFSKVNFSQAIEIYTDTLQQAPYEFVVNNNKFRFSLNREEYIVSIEKFSSTWTLIDTVSFFHQILLKDINNDGYLDIGFYEKWTADVWLFNPKINNYIHSGDYPINLRVELGVVYNNTKFSEKLRTNITISVTINRIVNEEENEVKVLKWNKQRKFNYAAYWKKSWRKFLGK